MAGGALFDVSELVALEAALAKAPVAAMAEVRGAVQTASLALKTAWQSNAAGTSGLRGHNYPQSILYETKVSGDGVTGEIGPRSGVGQGGLGRGFEFGSVHQPPHLDGMKATDAIEPVFVQALTAAIAKAAAL